MDLNNKESFDSFIEKYVSDKKNYTHLIYVHAKEDVDIKEGLESRTHSSTKTLFVRKYYKIPFSMLDRFYDLYLHKIKNCSNLNNLVYVCELSDAYSHLFLDLDFNFDTPDDDISKEQTKKIINLLEIIISKYVPLSISDTSCIVLKRSYAIKKTIYSNKVTKTVYRRGLHIHFPYIFTNYTSSMLIRTKVMDYLDLHHNSKFFDINHNNSLDFIIDDHVFHSRPLQLYKSTRPDHYSDNCYLPFVTTKRFESIDKSDDKLLLCILSKHNECKRITQQNKNIMCTFIVQSPIHYSATQNKIINDDYEDLEDGEYNHLEFVSIS